MKLLLALLLLAVPAAFYYAWYAMPSPQYAQNDTLSSGELATRSGTNADANNRLDFSGGEQRRYRKPIHNLFGPLFPPPPPPTPPKVEVIPPPVLPVAPVVAQAPPPVVTPPPRLVATVPMPDFKVLGFLEKGAQLTAFISLQGAVHLVKQGDVFAEQFKVVELTIQSITLRRVRGTGEVTLPIHEKLGSSANTASKISSKASRAPARIFQPQNRTVSPFVRPESRPVMPVVRPAVNDAK
ncbi:MAG: hypothetical protein L3J63_00450 [Geopsychrobacter sp.]|nr:hypothetical protein [Geopsychrobacter sp.]